MSVRYRNNVHVQGDGDATIIFGHGFGCDQNMWRFLVPPLAQRYRVVTFDLMGCGLSDLTAYEKSKYSALQGYAEDLQDILQEFGKGPVIYIGHSASAAIGVCADLTYPGSISAQVMLSPSPCYINDGDYFGGLQRPAMEALLNAIDENYLGWSMSMGPSIMGAPEQPALAQELVNSFCRTDPNIAKQFARLIFLGDYRELLPKLHTPTLIVQCSDDLIVPVAVGEYMARTLPNATLQVIENVGHLPHLSEPAVCLSVIEEFLANLQNTWHTGQISA